MPVSAIFRISYHNFGVYLILILILVRKVAQSRLFLRPYILPDLVRFVAKVTVSTILYMDSTYFTTNNFTLNRIRCGRIYGLLLRELLSSLWCLRTYYPLRFGSLYDFRDRQVLIGWSYRLCYIIIVKFLFVLFNQLCCN